MDMWTKIKAHFKAWGKAMIEARQETANRQIALMQLHGLSDRELHDIGVNRYDIKRVVFED